MPPSDANDIRLAELSRRLFRQKTMFDHCMTAGQLTLVFNRTQEMMKTLTEIQDRINELQYSQEKT